MHRRQTLDCRSDHCRSSSPKVRVCGGRLYPGSGVGLQRPEVRHIQPHVGRRIPVRYCRGRHPEGWNLRRTHWALRYPLAWAPPPSPFVLFGTAVDTQAPPPKVSGRCHQTRADGVVRKRIVSHVRQRCPSRLDLAQRPDAWTTTDFTHKLSGTHTPWGSCQCAPASMLQLL